MAGEKALTYEEFIALAKENYTKGGDVAAECWDKKVFDGYVKILGRSQRQRPSGCSASGWMRRKSGKL